MQKLATSKWYPITAGKKEKSQKKKGNRLMMFAKLLIRSSCYHAILLTSAFQFVFGHGGRVDRPSD